MTTAGGQDGPAESEPERSLGPQDPEPEPERSRESAVAKRERIADERDRVADERDQLADQREDLANDRERVADQREGTAEDREQERQRRAGNLRDRARAGTRREQANIARETAATERAEAREEDAPSSAGQSPPQSRVDARVRDRLVDERQYPFDLGGFSRATSTSNPEAEVWFSRGLVWSYAFHHEEAVGCFEQAVSLDPECAIGYWGIAYASGPNYNKQWDAFDELDLHTSLRRAYDAAVRAAELAGTASSAEQGLIGALAERYPSPEPDDRLGSGVTRYAEAMAEVYAAHPGDLDVAALYADALMNITAWKLWDLSTGEPADGARTLEARRVLEAALDEPGGMTHPGLLHLYIHLLEMSREPETAQRAANALRGLVPDAAHLLHMPTHIDVLTGDYARVIGDNEQAICADDRYVEYAGRLNFYSLYRAHDHHFRIYGAMFAGRRATALAAADDLARSLPEDLLRIESPPMADWLESFAGMRFHVLIRFGMWATVVAEPLPADPELYCVTTALAHYAKGVAHAARTETGAARGQREELAAAVARVPETRYLFNNQALDILAVAGAMLDGEIAYREGDYQGAWRHLRAAIELDDGLPYDEPWGWMQPARHAYGALLLEQGEVETAAAVYAADLGFDATLARACQHPLNVWSLHGYHECMRRLDRHEDAARIKPQLEHALAVADIEIESSCFCRTDAVSP